MSAPIRALRYGVQPPCRSETLDETAAMSLEIAERLAVLAQADDCHRLTNFALVFRHLATSLGDYGDYCEEMIREGWDAL